MSVTVVDRRCTAADTPDPEIDAERLARRCDVRQQAARRDIELQPAILAEADIRASEARCDQAADEHATATAPLQQELAELEQAAIARIGQRLPPDAEQDERRAELVGLIAEATRELEVTIERERELQGVARRKARRCREGHPPSDTILAALAKPPLASPKLLAELHVCQQRVKWLRARQAAAEKSLRIHQYNRDEIQSGRMHGDLEANLRRLAAWQAECSAVSGELAEAMGEAEQIHQRLIDE